VPTSFEQKRKASSDNFLFLQWADLKNSRINAYRAGTQVILEIELGGPVRGNWPNYGKLDDTRYHCHIRKGKPCYVAVWQVTDATIKLVKVNYVGTHEKAPY
jgi:hypothetical protein